MGACWAHAGAARTTATIRATAVTMTRFPDSFFVLIELPYFDIVFLYVMIVYGQLNERRFSMKKVAIQIYLDPEQNRVISQLSKAKGKSKTALIRSCIARFIADIPPEEDPALGVIGLGASGKKDISERHDEILGRGRR